MTDAVTPFRLETGTDQLEDLRQRLAHARWPEPAPVTDWSQGVPVDWLRDLCAYWQDGYDWRRGGEEWTPSAEWKRSLTALIRERAPRQGAILEIGPGAGRWTEALQKLAGALTVVDVSRTSIEACRARLAGSDNVRYLVNDGRTLPDIPDDSIDFIWSFDTFVHVSPEDTAAYAGEFRRVLRRGGRGIVHHPASGGLRGGFRSRMTSDAFMSLLRSTGLVPLEQFDSWGPQGAFDVKHFGDAITVFAKE